MYRYGSLCEPDVIDAFRRIGLEVDEETAEIYNKNLMPSQCSAIVAPRLTGNNYSFVFTINFFPWLSDICQITGLIYISLIVDSPVLELYSNALSNNVNRVFLFDRLLYNEFCRYNNGHIFHIPLATNLIRSNKVISSASKDKSSQYNSDCLLYTSDAADD